MLSLKSEKRSPIVAIDGPAGAGKSTVARILAYQLGFTLIDTGALYRTLAMVAMERGVPLDHGPSLAALCDSLKFQFSKLEKHEGEIPKLRIYVNGIEVTHDIRSPELGMAASKVSKLPEVRESLLNVQRNFAEAGGIVMEGRDIGTVIFPNAELKFFLTASVESRAGRRFEELKNNGFEITLEQVIRETQARDEQDMNRALAPLKQAPDAILVDSSDKSLDEVVGLMFQKVKDYIQS